MRIRPASAHDGRPTQLRVAVVTDGLYPYFKGGKEVRFHELLRRVVRPDVTVDIYTMRWWGDDEQEAVDGIRLHGICRPRSLYSGNRRSILQAVIFALACVRLIGVKADLIDADQMPYLQLFPLRLIAWFRGVPLVVTWHEWWGPEYWRQYLGRLGVIAALVERSASRLADHVVVPSRGTADRLLADGLDPTRVSVLPLGIDEDAITAAPEADDAWDILYVGRLLEHKQVHTVIEALALLRENGLHLQCAIVGEGPEEDRLRQLVDQRQLGGQVTFVGRLEHQHEVFGLMKRSSVFASPSTREGFGITVLEAVACGAKVVTSDHPDNHARHLVDAGVTGFLCQPEPAAVAGAIEEALVLKQSEEIDLRDPKVRSWGGAADELLTIYRDKCA